MRRDVSPLRGEARPQKRFCLPRTRSPHLNLSQPPFEAWCADLVHPSFLLGLAVGGRVRLSPFAARLFAAGEPHVRRHSCFSPAVYGTRAGHPSAQHFSLHHPEHGRRGLSFTVEGAAASRPSRHPISGMSSLTRHSDSSVTLPSRMGASTGGIAVGSQHFSNQLHSSVWKKSPPPRFDGVHLTVVNSASKASVLQQELSSLLQKGAIEEVPQSEVERGFFSRYFLVPKRDGGLRPILDLRRLNFSLYKGKFKMLTMRTIMSQVQEGDWFVTIDLKDAYFHIQVVQRHRRFLRFAFRGKAYQYKVLPFGLALAPRTFTKCMDAALAPFTVLLTVPASGQDLASSAGALEVVGMTHTGPRAVIDGLPAEVQETIASARAPATRKLYSSKWGVFESWCLTRAIDPVNCPVGPVLEFLQERLTAGAAATTLRVYVAAIAARRELDEIPLGRHRMVSSFMRGVRRLRPVRPTAVPSWDLSVVLEGLVTAPFEPLESASDRILTLKVVLLLALTSLKRVGDLQAFSVSETCMDFAPGLVKVTLRPRPGYIPKVLSTSFRSQVVTLHSFHPPPLLQVRMRDSTCSTRSGHWSCMWIAPRFGENLPSYWSVWCWSPRACHVKAEDFSLGERRHFAGLRGAETPFTS